MFPMLMVFVLVAAASQRLDVAGDLLFDFSRLVGVFRKAAFTRQRDQNRITVWDLKANDLLAKNSAA